MCFETMFFDLDDTLYPSTSGIWEAIGDRMSQYMVERMGMSVDQVAGERDRLFHLHGTTLRGLVTEYQVNDIEFLEYVHDIPIRQYIGEDLALQRTLSMYPQRKIIFTNADSHHAQRVMDTLGVTRFFDSVIDIRLIRPLCKPMPDAFTIALELTGVENPDCCVMLDDAHRNLVTASNLGMFTIQVGTRTRNPHVDAAVFSLIELPDVIQVPNSEVLHE